jgi:RHS repeat-associated protein
MPGGSSETAPGNTGDSEITIYTWDNRNRLASVSYYGTETAYAASTPDHVVSYNYDAYNRWVGETVTTYAEGSPTVSTQTNFAYDGSQIVLQFTGTAGSPLTAGSLADRYLWGSGVDQLLAQETVGGNTAAGSVLWALTDNQGTVRDMASLSGGSTTVQQHRVYNSFGGLTNLAPTQVDSIFGYDGQPFDPNTLLQNDLNRWYNPATGCWESPDPAAADANLYRYCGNAPTDGIDPSGLQPPVVIGPAGLQGWSDSIYNISKEAATPAPAFDPWALKPNWKGATGALVGTSQEVFMDFGCLGEKELKKLEDFAWGLVVKFKGFNGTETNKNSAQVELLEPTPAQIGLDPSLKGAVIGKFTMNDAISTNGAYLSGAGDGPDTAFYVRLFIDNDKRTITAVTLGSHGLVGIRQWQVKAYRQKEPWSGGHHSIRAGDAILRVSTAAWEQRNNPVTNLFYWATAQDQAKQLWSFYLNAIVSKVTAEADTVTKIIAKTWLEVYKDRELPASTKNPFSDVLPEAFRQP